MAVEEEEGEEEVVVRIPSQEIFTLPKVSVFIHSLQYTTRTLPMQYGRMYLQCTQVIFKHGICLV